VDPFEVQGSDWRAELDVTLADLVVAFRRVLGASKDTAHIFDAYNVENDAVVLNFYHIDSNLKPPSLFGRRCRTVITIPAGLKLKFVKR
jgi:hypothetical protein